MLPGNVQQVKRENLRRLARSMGGGRDVLNREGQFPVACVFCSGIIER